MIDQFWIVWLWNWWKVYSVSDIYIILMQLITVPGTRCFQWAILECFENIILAPIKEQFQVVYEPPHLYSSIATGINAIVCITLLTLIGKLETNLFSTLPSTFDKWFHLSAVNLSVRYTTLLNVYNLQQTWFQAVDSKHVALIRISNYISLNRGHSLHRTYTRQSDFARWPEGRTSEVRSSPWMRCYVLFEETFRLQWLKLYCGQLSRLGITDNDEVLAVSVAFGLGL